MVKRIFRLDDVTTNISPFELNKQVCLLNEVDPLADIWFCITLFNKKNAQGSVYPNPPFKMKDRLFFYDVDSITDIFSVSTYLDWDVKICSHGLWHIDHSMASYEIQEASIRTSCSYLNTDIFVPPFNRWSKVTDEICEKAQIQLIKYETGWKSLDMNPYDQSHNLWYYHPWKFTEESLRKALSVENKLHI